MLINESRKLLLVGCTLLLNVSKPSSLDLDTGPGTDEASMDEGAMSPGWGHCTQSSPKGVLGLQGKKNLELVQPYVVMDKDRGSFRDGIPFLRTHPLHGETGFV